MDHSNAHDKQPLLGEDGEGRSEFPDTLELDSADEVYYTGTRAKTDKAWVTAFYVLISVVLVMSCAVVMAGDHKSFDLLHDDAYMSSPHNCPASSSTPAPLLHRSLLSHHTDSYEPKFLKHTAVWLVASLLLSLFSGVVFLKCFQWHPMTMIVLSAGVLVALWVVTAVAAFAAGAIIPGLIGAGLAALTAYLFLRRRERMVLCARLFGCASSGLNANPAILGLTLALWVAASLVYLFAAVLLMFAYTNGHLVAVADSPSRPDSFEVHDDSCTVAYLVEEDASGKLRPVQTPTPCCEWQLETWIYAYAMVLMLAVVWVVQTMFELQVFVAGGTITQWYYAPAGASTRGTLRRSLGHALGPQFGTVLLGGFIMAAVKTFQTLARSVSHRSRNPLVCILGLIARAILRFIAFLTRFATVYAAVRGTPFLESAKTATEMLKDNGMMTVRVWWFPSFVIGISSLGFGFFYGLAAWLATKGFVTFWAAVMLGAVTGVASFMVMQLCGGILLQALEAVYLCYGFDKANSLVTNPEIHGVYAALPVHDKAPGAVVAQPGGEVGYAPLRGDNASA